MTDGKHKFMHLKWTAPDGQNVTEATTTYPGYPGTYSRSNTRTANGMHQHYMYNVRGVAAAYSHLPGTFVCVECAWCWVMPRARGRARAAHVFKT